MTTSLELELRGAARTLAFGRVLGETCPGALTLCLRGHLGAGKTTLVKGLAAGLGVAHEDDVTSPTFLRMVRYDQTGSTSLVHVDAYRLGSDDEVFELGLTDEFRGDALVAVEWPGNIESSLPADRLEVALAHRGPEARGVELSATGPLAGAWLAAFAARWEGEA